MKSCVFLLSTCLVSFFLSTPAYPDIIYVPSDYTTIQEAIDAASNGDTVFVSPATYVENIDFLGKAITVKSTHGPEGTVIDGGNPVDPDFGSVVTFTSGESHDSILKGFTITNGSGTRFEYTQNHWALCGGGIFCVDSRPSIKHVIIRENEVNNNGRGGGVYCNGIQSAVIWESTITENKASEGAGVCCDASQAILINNMISTNTSLAANNSGAGISCNFNAEPSIMDNFIIGNTTGPLHGQGGAIYSKDSSPAITGNTIQANEADSGAGIYCFRSSPWIVNNRITDNVASFAGKGGGISCNGFCDSFISGNLIANNKASSYNGGIGCVDSAVIVNNWILGNSSEYVGGGIGVSHSGFCTIANNVISGNSSELGAGIYCARPEAEIVNNTIIHNTASWQGGGIFTVSGTPVVVNTILWDNTASEGPEICVCPVSHTPSSLEVSHSLVKGGLASTYVHPGCTLEWGAGMIDADPLFVDAENGDFHLTFTSPCRGSGDNSVHGVQQHDFEGDPRIYQGTVDMGADEFHAHLYCTGEFTPEGEITGKLVGLPGMSPVGLFIGSGVLDPPMQHAWGEFHLEAPWFLVPLLPIPSNGVLQIPETIPASPAAPYEIPLQALIGNQLSNLFVLEVR